jgi:hypothetical protein
LGLCEMVATLCGHSQFCAICLLPYRFWRVHLGERELGSLELGWGLSSVVGVKQMKPKYVAEA